MEYLENSLFSANLVVDYADSPRPERGFGRMVYYHKSSRRLLTSAPRKREDYIHVVLCIGTLDKNTLLKQGFILGNGSGRNQDVKISDEKQIDTLINLLHEQINSSVNIVSNHSTSLPVTLEEWVNAYYSDEDYLEKKRKVDDARRELLNHFTELNQLRNGNLSFYEFKKTIDKKMKSREVIVDGDNIWGFSGFSGQMFFNQLYNQAEAANMVEEAKNAFLSAIHIPEHNKEDYSWAVKKMQEFSQVVHNIKKQAIENGYSPQKCAAIKFSTFFLSFFWGIQDITKYPIYYKASRDGLEYLGYTFDKETKNFDGTKYLNFVDHLLTIKEEIEEIAEQTETIDMDFLASFLYYVVIRTNDEEEEVKPNQVAQDPIHIHPFAHTLHDYLNKLDYIVSDMETLEDPSLLLPRANTHSIVWKFICKSEGNLHSFLFEWHNDTEYVCDVYEENEEGKIGHLFHIHEDHEEAFLEKLHQNFTRDMGVQRTYTLDDAAREVYLEREILEEWLDVLSEKRQMILYGPPGTGKTFVAQRLAKILAQTERKIKLIQFHPSYTYEEFIEGLRPELIQNEQGVSQLSVAVKEGIFTELCREARKQENQSRPYVLIIDEINRANTAKVFGELLYSLEYRNTAIPLPYSKKKLIVPDNIYIIGTMNTTDRSLSQIDFALRRRFQFIPFATKETEHVLERFLDQHVPDMQWVSQLVSYVNKVIDSPEHSIGHSYFMFSELDEASLRRIWKFQILPYLEEVFVTQPHKLKELELKVLLQESVFLDE
jgi:5-methylcytosine-specific restriction protein B